MLPTNGAPYSIPKHISQSIEPNAVDRFTFTFVNDAKTNDDFIFQMKLELISDENDKSLTSPNLLFIAPGRSGLYTELVVPEDVNGTKIFDRYTVGNKLIVAEINNIEGIKSERLNELIRAFS